LAESVGINQAAQRLGMPASSLGNWMRRKRSGKLLAVFRSDANEGFASRVGSGEQSVAARAGKHQA